MTTPEVFQIKLSAQQLRDFSASAQMCGLDLAAWIVQCADVRAAAAIDAMQALQRVQRPDRKKQRPRLRAAAETPAAETPAAETATSVTMKAARSYNERFRRRGAKHSRSASFVDEEGR